MARLMATVVNGGKLYEPYLVMDPDKKIKPKGTVKIKPENLELIKNALLGVVEDKHGTGWLSRSNIARIGGKTGTSQVIGGVTKEQELPEKYKDHAWFIAFSSDKSPQIAVAVFVEHGGHGSSAAAPIAKKIIEAFYKNNQKSEQD
jgi:penicillin-binding protein 2